MRNNPEEQIMGTHLILKITWKGKNISLHLPDMAFFYDFK